MLPGKRSLRAVVALPTVAGLLIAGIQPPPQAFAQVASQTASPSALSSRGDYESCQSHDEASFRPAIEKVTQAALERGLKSMDYLAAVGDEWRRGNVDQVMADRIDKTIDEIRSETGFTDQISSLFSKETAQRLATTAAERVYRSDTMKSVIERIAEGVGREVGKRLEIATADAAEPAMKCLEAFLGPRYGTTVAAVVAGNAARDFALDGKGVANVSSAKVIAEGGSAIAGAIILIVRRQLANLAARIGQRLVGAVLSRVVSVIAGGIGIALIAKDLWELRHGALPIIASEMKSSATRDKVQEELARAIGEQVGEHVREISVKTTDRILEIWGEFKRAHAKVLELADKDPTFRSFVDTLSAASLPRLDEVVALVLASESEAAILKRLGDGSLHRAVTVLPASAMTIARELRSIDAGLQWFALAGERMPKVVETEIFRRNHAGEFSNASLTKLLELDDRLAVTRLASLKSQVRDPLLELKDADLKTLARALEEPQLATLSGYLTGLDRAAGQRLLSSVAASPAKMQAISPQSVRDAIFASRDQAAAVAMMLRGDSIFDFFVFGDDVGLVQQGRVSWKLLWARYPTFIPALGMAGLLLLLLLWRLLFGRRPRIVVNLPPQPRSGPHT